MANSQQIYSLILSHTECKSYQALLKKASFYFRQPLELITLFFVKSDDSQTQIQSDGDLLALKYMVRSKNLMFKVEISKSQEQIQEEIITQSVEEYLGSIYGQVEEEEHQRAVDLEIEEYLDQLYRRVTRREEREKTLKIQGEEVGKYMDSMVGQIVGKKVSKKIPTREARQRMVRVSPQKQLFRRKEGSIEVMVGRILQSMMPVMVKELSYRIVQELKMSQRPSLTSTMSECHLNPQEL